ncbi:AMP-binding protein [Actinomadura sp. 7K507]|uniref:AMP-binding protein n=1 Tax=Actinomadura sp. 7K507 TaxID=2530365 RepID=UPI0010437A31|nr:AMP-binding protein [Actinomadura sp. 7K507]TDC92985.1 AMP-dependent synthetase [Actinomadura sp. 7K507]
MAELLEPHVRSKPDAIALIDDNGAQTWAQTNARVNRLIHVLDSLGCRPGDRIALMARNSREWWETTLAAIHAGLISVPVNWHWRHEELAYVLGDSESRVLFAGAEQVEVAERALAALGPAAPRLIVIGSDHRPGALEYGAALRTAPSTDPEAPFGTRPMMYTSGTTGMPKGVLHNDGLSTAAEFAAGARAFLDLMSMRPGTTTLIAGPAYHSAQWSFALLPLVTGSTLVTPSRCSTKSILDLVDEHRVGNVHLVPTQFVRLLRLPEETRAVFSGASLSVVAHGGAPCARSVKREMVEWWGPVITEYYGGTETGLVTLITAGEWLAHPGSVGHGIPGVEIRIVDGTGAEVAGGTTGVIWARRPGKDFEYFNAPDKTRDAHDTEGFATTGDMGHVTDGFLYISDRMTDMIISGGVNIYPAEIENVLHEHPQVVDVAVVGAPDEEFGEIVVAYVVAEDHETPGLEAALEAELQAYCRSRLTGFKCPRIFRFADDLPRNATGKLLKRKLRDALWADHDQQI